VIILKISYIAFLRGKTMSEKDVPLDSLKIYIDKALKLKFKAMCALQDKDMSAVASGLIDEWVKHNETPPQQQG
jgi:hypothetical protein